jgi:hypothetical protein
VESETQKLDALLTNESKEDFESTIRFDQLKTDDEWGVFKNRVQDSKGVVRVFMHPSGLLENKKLENETFEGYKGPQPLGDKPIFFLLRVAEKESAPPIIVFENDNRIDSFCRNVQAIQDKYGDAIAHPLYVLPTLNQYPYPKLSDRNEPIRDGEGWLPEDAYDYCLESMTRFVSALELAGVKKLL